MTKLYYTYYKLTRKRTDDNTVHTLIVMALYDNHQRLEGYFDIKGKMIGAVWGLMPLLPYPAAVEVSECAVDPNKLQLDFDILVKCETELSQSSISKSRFNDKTKQKYFKISDSFYIDSSGRRYLNNAEFGWLFGLPNFSSGSPEEIHFDAFDLDAFGEEEDKYNEPEVTKNNANE